MISVPCTKCGATLKVKDEFAGKTGKCPRCAATINVPAGSSASQSGTIVDEDISQSRVSTKTIRAASSAARKASASESAAKSFTQPASREELRALIEKLPRTYVRPETSKNYKFSLMIMAALSIMLPLIYLSIVAGVGFITLWWITNGVPVPIVGVLASLIALVVLYIAPIATGGALLLVLLRPLIMFSSREAAGAAITRESDPFLWQTVEQICRVVGSPVPREIRVDCKARHEAALRGGLLSLFGSNLILTIGLPLVAVLKTDQCCGQLAHELARFNQGAVMRLLHIVRIVNQWLTKASQSATDFEYSVDSMRDRSLASLNSGISTRKAGIMEMFYFVMQILVGVVSGAMWVLLQISDLLCARTLRHQDLDSDLFEIQLVGSKAFEATVRQSAVTRLAEVSALKVMADHYKRSDQLPVNFPELVALIKEADEEKLRSEVRLLIRKRAKSFRDVTPPMQERIEIARGKEIEGVLDFDAPASILFKDFETASRAASTALYHETIGTKIARAKFVASAPLVRGQSR